jgi:hypothetical protein
MFDAVGLVIGNFTYYLDKVSHFVLVGFRNVLFFGFLLAVIWGFYRLGLRAVRYLRGMRGEELEHGRRIPKEKPEDGSV